MKLRLFRLIIFLVVLLVGIFSAVNAQVTADFTANRTSGCAPISVNFTNTSTGATSYSWNFGNGNTSAQTNPGATYNTAGTYNVVLTATNGASSSTHTLTINVYGNPTPDFTTSALPTCVGQMVSFADNSTPGSGTLSTWNWDFGDGSSQTTPSSSIGHEYTTSGIFPVTVIVTNSFGCSRNIIHDVEILAGPLANFVAVGPTSACVAPLSVNFTNTSTVFGAATYNWNFGDGNTSTQENPSHTYNFQGNYTVSLEVVQQGCRDTAVMTNFVTIENISPDFSANNTVVCVGDTVTFTDLSNPLTTSRTWNFGDGVTSVQANPTHVYSTAGTYTVSMLNAVANGCTGSTSKPDYVTVNPSAIVSFAADQTRSCSAPFTVTFNDNSVNAVSWSWDFGDGNTSNNRNPVHTYSNPGAYNVSLTVTSNNGCQTTLVRNNYIVISTPTADFTATPTEGCIPLPVTFDASVLSPGDAVVNYSWDFGNGTASGISPTVPRNYPTVGRYTVRLIITTAMGCKDTVTKVDYIRAGTPPVANFSIVDPEICHGTEAEFTDLSVGADSAHWEFDVDQGTFDTPFGVNLPFNPVLHEFTDTGLFYVRQIAYFNGCPDTFQIADAIRILPPLPAISYTLSCITPFDVQVENRSLAADSIVWNFGDGSPLISDVQQLTHTYIGSGPIFVRLTVFNFSNGCSSRMTLPLTLADPKANISSLNNIGCYNLPVTFTNLSVDEDTVTWDFGDGSAFSTDTTSFVHVYDTPGAYRVKLTVTDVNGCIDSTFSTVTVLGAIPNFSANNVAGCTPFNVIFSDGSRSDSAIVQWDWNFGDGTPVQSTANPTINHTYTVSGVYSVTMTATDKNGCTKVRRRNNYIESTFPIPAIVTDTFACKQEGIFLDASSTLVEEPASFDWTLGDGTTDIGQGIVHFYAVDSLYNVQLTVTDKNGCIATQQHTIRVQTPDAAFTYSVITQACGVSDIQFTDLSTGHSITNWQWSFGDGASSSQQNPSHLYTRPGLFPVRLIVSNVANCRDTFLIDSVLVLGPVGTFTFTPNRGCIPLEVTFTATSSNATNYTWDFGDGTIINTTIPVYKHTYTQADTATPFLLLGNVLPDGSPCQFPAPTAGDIVATTPVTIIIDSILNLPCNGDSIGAIFTSVSGGTAPYSYVWSTNPIQTLSAATGLSAGSYTLMVTDSNFCVEPIVADVTQPSPVITAMGINDTVCSGQVATLNASASGGTGTYLYSWQPANVVNAGALNVTAISDSLITVRAYDQNNCMGTLDTAMVIIYKLPFDSVQITSDSPICPGESSDIEVNVSGPTGPLSYQWIPNIGNGPGPYSVIPIVPSTYVVTVSNTCGESVTRGVNVAFYPPPTINITSDPLEICAPDTVRFFDSSVSSNPLDPVSNWVWNFGDGSPVSNEQNPSHVFTQPGTFNITLTVTTGNGCTNNNATTPYTVVGHPYPIANFVVNATALKLPYDEVKTRNFSVNAVSYAWSFGDGGTSVDFQPSHVYSKVGKFPIQLVATSNFGCTDTMSLNVVTSADIAFPNVFTPNSTFSSGGAYDENSMENDVFFPYTAGVEGYKFQVFNRWGELIFESTDVKIGWDGYYKGKLCEQDVYIWKAYIRHNDGSAYELAGDVTLLR